MDEFVGIMSSNRVQDRSLIAANGRVKGSIWLALLYGWGTECVMYFWLECVDIFGHISVPYRIQCTTTMHFVEFKPDN